MKKLFTPSVQLHKGTEQLRQEQNEDTLKGPSGFLQIYFQLREILPL